MQSIKTFMQTYWEAREQLRMQYDSHSSSLLQEVATLSFIERRQARPYTYKILHIEQSGGDSYVVQTLEQEKGGMVERLNYRLASTAKGWLIEKIWIYESHGFEDESPSVWETCR